MAGFDLTEYGFRKNSNLISCFDIDVSEFDLLSYSILCLALQALHVFADRIAENSACAAGIGD